VQKLQITPLLVFIVSFCCQSNLWAEDWPQFGGPSSNFQLNGEAKLDTDKFVPTFRWKRTLGDGMSSLVASGDLLYTTYLAPPTDIDESKPQQQRAHREVVVALDRSSGNTQWAYEYDAGWIDDQEAFGGRVRSPQATPVIIQDSLVTVGFTGLLHCFDQATGKVKWKLNLIDRFGAIPVQFGFSSSPIEQNGRLIVLAGGEQGGLLSLDVDSGEVQWNLPCQEASYATPVVFSVGETSQVAFVTRNHVIGVKCESGELLWRYPLPKPGLTNVPTPLHVGGGRLIVSGQGCGGTRELKVSRAGERWQVDEGWFSRTQFFYCNWILWDQLIIGCNGDLLVAMDAESGTTVGRWRGFANSNLVAEADKLLILNGNGELITALAKQESLQILSRHQLMDQRCWVPPSVTGQNIFCRAGRQIVCVQMTDDPALAKLKPLRIKQAELSMRPAKGKVSKAEAIDPVDQIISAFEKQGPQPGQDVYVSLRQQGDDLKLEHRRALAELAVGQGLIDFAKQILSHAVEDFPDLAEARQMQQSMLEEMTPRLSSKTNRGENGLVYVQFRIRNDTWKTVQTYVKGPQEHPFSYGIPFRIGSSRVETWPVGTRLYETEHGIRSSVLLTVEESYAGKTINLKRNPNAIDLVPK
jgi:outer membrane protein assembly factor BamB